MTLTIIAGGSTGAERGALQAAIDMGFAIGGWRCAGDDTPPIFAGSMRETSSTDRGMARRLCVQDSDGTLALSSSIALVGAVAWADRVTEQQGKPFLSITLGQQLPEAVRGSVADWIRANDISRLYITGPAEDDEPGVGARVRAAVRWLFEGEALEQLGKFIDVVKLLEGATDAGPGTLTTLYDRTDQPILANAADGPLETRQEPPDQLADPPSPSETFESSFAALFAPVVGSESTALASPETCGGATRSEGDQTA